MSAWPQAVYIIKEIQNSLGLTNRIVELQNRLYVFAKQKGNQRVPDLEGTYDFSSDSVWFVQNNSGKIYAASVYSESQGWSEFMPFTANGNEISFTPSTADTILSGQTNIDGAIKTLSAAVASGAGGGGSVDIATTAAAGIVKIPTDNSIKITNGVISVPLASTSGTKGILTPSSASFTGADGTLSLRTASSSVLGGVKIGTGVSISSGKINLSTATSSAIGGVVVGDNIQVNSGTISVPVATTGSTKGVVSIGNYMSINNSGAISPTTASGTQPGIMKLYSSLGDSTDGTMTRGAIQAAINSASTIKSESVAIQPSSWSNTTTTLNGGTVPYYSYPASLTTAYGSYPTVDLIATSPYDIPSTAERDAYSKVKYVTANGNQLTLYASIKPTVKFTISVKA